MSLEERLVRTLHRVDAYEPSPDLFARTAVSIAEDRAMRRQTRQTFAGMLGAGAGAAAWLTVATTTTPAGRRVLPGWSLELLETVVLIAALVLLGPVIRRFGRIYVDAAFHARPDTGARFVRLLDVAYYLTFTGVILAGADLESLDRAVGLLSGVDRAMERAGVFLGLMGAAHAANLLIMPVVGLIFTATNRRALRRRAGDAAPPRSPRAVRADRIATWLVVGAALVAAVVGLQLLGVVIGLGIG